MISSAREWLLWVNRFCIKPPFRSNQGSRFNALLHDKNFVVFNLKIFASDNFFVAQMVNFFCDEVENIVGKEENVAYRHFSPFPRKFSQDFLSRLIKKRYCAVKCEHIAEKG